MASTAELANLIGREQDGLALRSQLHAAGVSDRTIRRWLAAGRWSLRLPAVVDLGTHSRSWWQSTRALLLAAGEGSLVSHATAAVLHELPDIRRPQLPDVLVLRGRHPCVGGHRLHTTVRLAEHEIEELDGWPVTSVSRTLVDLAPRQSDDWLQLAIGQSLRRGTTTRTAVVESAALRVGAAATDRVVRAAAGVPDAIDRTESPLEVRGVLALTRMGMLPPAIQYEVVLRGTRYRFDAAWPALRLAIEFDGAAWHETTIRSGRDAVKDGDAEAEGWTVERLRDRDVRDPWASKRVGRIRSIVL